MPRVLLAGLAVLLLAVAALWWLTVPAEGPADGADPVQAAEPEEQAATWLPVDLGESAPVAEREELVPAPETGGAGEVAGAGAAADAPEAGFLIRIVRADDGEPVPYATVLYGDDHFLDEQQLQSELALQRSIEGVLRKLGWEYRADAAGQVRVPYAEGNAIVHARSGRLATSVPLRPDAAQPFEVALEQELAVAVQVVDADGRPQLGVPTTVRIYEGGESMDTLGARTHAPDGIAVIGGLDILLNQKADAPHAKAALALPLAERVEDGFDLEEPPEEPVVLVLPPVGKVVVNVVDADGEPVDAPFQVMLRSAEGEEERAEEYWSEPLQFAGGMLARADEGQAVFPWVGLDLQLDVLVRMEATEATAFARRPGPTRAGEAVSLTLQPRMARPVLVGVVLMPGGEPLRDATLRADFRPESGRPFQRLLRTDAAGRFRLVLEPVSGIPEADAKLVLNHEARPGATLSATVGFTSYPETGAPLDLGAIALAEPAVLLAGRVRDPTGKGVPGAMVFIERRPRRDAPHQDSWISVRDPVRTGADGSFAVDGRPDPGDYRIRTRASGWQDTVVQVRAGEQGIEIILEAEARLEGSLILDDDRSEMQFALILHTRLPGQSPEERPRSQAQRPGEDGRFRWTRLAPGTAEFELRVQETQQLLLRVDGIELISGRTTRDPRLQEIDLRGMFRTVTLTAVDAGGSPVRAARAWFLERGAQGSRQYLSSKDGVFRVPVRSGDAPWVQVYADGHRSVVVDDLSADREVLLPKAPTLRVILDGSPVPAPGWQLEVGLQSLWMEGRRWGRNLDFVPFDAAGEARLPIEGEGEHRILILLRRTLGGAGRNNVLLQPSQGGNFGAFHARDVIGEKTVYVTVTAAEVQAGMADVAGQ